AGRRSRLVVGVKSGAFTTSALTTTTSYWVRVTNSSGNADSATATITVTSGGAPTITTQPASQSIASGATATLSVVLTGTGPFTKSEERRVGEERRAPWGRKR